MIEIRKIGVTKAGTDCIVNAANSALAAGGGVAGAIFREAGYDELQQACRKIGGCKEGSAVITPAFKLNAKHIIHAVGPVWQGGRHGERDKLYSCYQAAMQLAQENACCSIAFPLISSGIFGYPKQEAWEVALRSVSDYLDRHPSCGIDVTFAVLDNTILNMGQDILNGMQNAGNRQQKQEEEFTFFWKENEENGCFSQWYSAPFISEGIAYQTCEQYMMAKKALLFEDMKYYFAILGESDPEKCKKLGKCVRNYDDVRWTSCREEIVFHANLAKFSQNPALKRVLLATGDSTLAEASPYDDIWGIKLPASDPSARNPRYWKGLNLLGKALMKVRDILKNEPA